MRCERTVLFKFSGGFVERVTPVPIPNTEVKPLGADGTALEAAWESRKPPGLFLRKPARVLSSCGLLCVSYQRVARQLLLIQRFAVEEIQLLKAAS